MVEQCFWLLFSAWKLICRRGHWLYWHQVYYEGKNLFRGDFMGWKVSEVIWFFSEWLLRSVPATSKKVFSSDAFSVSSVTVWFSCWRAGIVSLFLLSSFSLPEISGIAHYLSKYSLFLILVRPTILFLSFLYCWKWASFNDLFAFMKRVLRLWRSWMMFFKPGKVTASFVDNDVECTLPW